jgi:cation transport ATPase
MGETHNIATVARERFGFEKLRPGQEEAVRSVLAGTDTLAVMATGSGKSAIYQLAGWMIDGVNSDSWTEAIFGHAGDPDHSHHRYAAAAYGVATFTGLWPMIPRAITSLRFGRLDMHVLVCLSAIGAAASSVLKKPLGQLAARTYRVTGPWKDPKVEVRKRAPATAPAKAGPSKPPAANPPSNG